jgi:hypothetical protein
MNLLAIIFLVFLITACNHKKIPEITHSELTKIDSINVLYYNGLFESIRQVHCDEMVYKPEKIKPVEFTSEGIEVPQGPIVLDTVITNPNILYTIEQEFDSLQSSDVDYIDARIKCFIYYKNKYIDTLCIDDNPKYAIYNNSRSVRLSNKLVYLIRENCGFYKWIGISRGMEYFEELNDTSFMREKVESITGEKY